MPNQALPRPGGQSQMLDDLHRQWRLFGGEPRAARPSPSPARRQSKCASVPSPASPLKTTRRARKTEPASPAFAQRENARPCARVGSRSALTALSADPCALAALSLQSRLTTERFDDAFGYVSACITGAVGFTGDVTTCAAPKQFVFRPSAGTLVGACMTPIPSTLAEGAACQTGSECQSGLCVDNKCNKPCVTTPADSCGATLKCDSQARAQLGANNGLTTVIPACRAACIADDTCGATSVCEPDDVDPLTPRFCRAKCAADKDCAAGQTCSPEGSPPRYCRAP